MTEANTINMEELYHKGLEPIDFARCTSPLQTEQFEELTSLDIGAERYGLEPTHIYNVLTEQEMEGLCYVRGYGEAKPSVLCVVDTLCKALQVSPDALPEGLVEAQMELNEERSYGARSFKNFTRRLERDQARKENKVANPHGNHKKKVRFALEKDRKTEVVTWD